MIALRGGAGTGARVVLGARQLAGPKIKRQVRTRLDLRWLCVRAVSESNERCAVNGAEGGGRAGGNRAGLR